MDKAQPQKNRATLLLMACVIMPAAIVFGITGDAPQTAILALIALIVSGMSPRPLDRSTRSFVYTGLGAIVVAVISDQIFPVRSERFFLLPAEIYCPLVIYLAIGLTFFDQRESNIAAVIALSLVAMMMAGNILDFRIPHERLPIPQSEERFVHLFYAGAVLIQMLGCIGLLPRAALLFPREENPHRYRLLKRCLLLTLVTTAAGVTFGLRVVAQRYEHVWQGGFIRLMQRYMLRSRDGTVFDREVDLWRTVPARSGEDTRVALRVLAKETPGYLRGRLYTTYEAGHWSAPNAASNLPREQVEGRLSYSVFTRLPPIHLHDIPPRPHTMDVLPTQHFRSDVLLAPGCATEFRLNAHTLSNSADGELTPSDWEEKVGYIMTVISDNDDTGYPGPRLDTSHVAPYLQVPKKLRSPLQKILDDALGTPAHPLPAKLAISRITRYLNKTCRYQLGIRFGPKSLDAGPVLLFLTDARRGHCELFASAAALLLRTAGIPTRYVTGIVCHEMVGQSHWVGRLMDLHAWCEAYDADAGMWIRVEATPAAGLPTQNKHVQPLEALFETIGFTWQHIMALLKRGTIAEAILAAGAAVVSLLGAVFLNPVGAPLGCLTLFALCFWWWRHRRRPAEGGSRSDREREQLSKVYLQAINVLRRRFTDLPECPTPLELEEAIARHTPSQREQWMPLLRRYERMRYGPGTIRPDDTEEWRREFRQRVRALATPSLKG